MDLKMRVTFEGNDYTFTVLTKDVNKRTRSIKINLGGVEYELTPNVRNEWNVTEVVTNENPALLRAIARNVSLRYRL